MRFHPFYYFGLISDCNFYSLAKICDIDVKDALRFENSIIFSFTDEIFWNYYEFQEPKSSLLKNFVVKLNIFSNYFLFIVKRINQS